MFEMNTLIIPLVIIFFVLVAFISLFNLTPQVTEIITSLRRGENTVAVQNNKTDAEPGDDTPSLLGTENEPKGNYIEVGSCQIKLEVANTDQQRRQGLSGRHHLERDSGMLFNLPQPKKQPFWMLDMQFPLDFVWIRDSKVVTVHHDIPTPEQVGRIVTVKPDEPVNYVLEINAGKAEECGIEVGDSVNLSITQ